MSCIYQIRYFDVSQSCCIVLTVKYIPEEHGVGQGEGGREHGVGQEEDAVGDEVGHEDLPHLLPLDVDEDLDNGMSGSKCRRSSTLVKV